MRRKLLWIAVIIVLYCIYHFIISYGGGHFVKELNFDGFNNVTGLADPIIPNLVHYVIFHSNEVNFITFLSIVSVLKVQHPSAVWIHSDHKKLTGRYWGFLIKLSIKVNVPIILKEFSIPTHVFGQPLSSIYHASDVARLVILQSYGGIYLDTDTLILNPLHNFLRYEMVLGWPEKDYLGTQILIAHKDARFLKYWLLGYKRYKPRTWYYNAGQFPTEQILNEYPEFVHRVKEKFGVHNLLEKLHGKDGWEDWPFYFSVHLLSRHPPTPNFLNEYVILEHESSFSNICKWILYGSSPRFDPTSKTINWK